MRLHKGGLEGRGLSWGIYALTRSSYIFYIYNIYSWEEYCDLSQKTLMSLNLSLAELELLTQLSEKKEMSKSAVLRQALRMMAVIEERINRGERLYFESLDKEKSEVVIL